MKTKETNKTATIKTINRLESELNDYFSDFDNLNGAFYDNFLAAQMQTICREALQNIIEVKKELGVS